MIWLQCLCILPVSCSANSIKQSCIINKAKPKTQRCVVSIFAHAQHRAEHTLLKNQQFKKGDKERAHLFLLWLALISKPVKCEVGQTLHNCVTDSWLWLSGNSLKRLRMSVNFLSGDQPYCNLKCAKFPSCWYCSAKWGYKTKESWYVLYQSVGMCTNLDIMITGFTCCYYCSTPRKWF